MSLQSIPRPNAVEAIINLSLVSLLQNLVTISSHISLSDAAVKTSISRNRRKLLGRPGDSVIFFPSNFFNIAHIFPQSFSDLQNITVLVALVQLLSRSFDSDSHNPIISGHGSIIIFLVVD